MRMGQNCRRVFGPRLRQGVKPPRIRPTSRAIGWHTWSNRTTIRKATALPLRARKPTEWVRAAEIAAWATGSAMVRSRAGPRNREACHPTPSRNIPNKRATSTYHSGISAQDQREPDDWYNDWNGAVPQTPWYTRPPSEEKSRATPRP